MRETRQDVLKKQEILAELEAVVHQRMGHISPLAARFLAQFYASVAHDDLIDRQTADLFGAAMAHFRQGHQKKDAGPSVHVYNPVMEQAGWQSPHTVVQIVTKDRPFLVDSVAMAVNRRGSRIHLIIHPVISVERDFDGRLIRVDAPGRDASADHESFMHVETSRISDPEGLNALRHEITRAIDSVTLAVDDFAAMKERLRDITKGLLSARTTVVTDEVDEACAFLEWVINDNFTLLGMSRSELRNDDRDGPQLFHVPGSELGILRPIHGEAARHEQFARLTREQRDAVTEPSPPMVLAKTMVPSLVHRPATLDFIGVKRYDVSGKMIGGDRIVGLWTSQHYNALPKDTPILRRKVANVTARLGLPPRGHNGKALVRVLETYPRDELLQIRSDELTEISRDIIEMQERPKIRVFLRKDRYGRYFSCLTFVPRDLFSTEIRQTFRGILKEVFASPQVDFEIFFSESILTRILYTVYCGDETPESADPREIEERFIASSRGWINHLYENLIEAEGEERGEQLFQNFAEALPVGYQERVDPRLAVTDIVRMDKLASGAGQLALGLYRPLDGDGDELRLKLVRREAPLALSDVLPVLENLGLCVLNELNSVVKSPRGQFHIHDFGMLPLSGSSLDLDAVRERFHEAFRKAWEGTIENDGFNRLVLLSGLDWRAVQVLRAYSRYMVQIGSTYSQAYIEQCLVANSDISTKLHQLFDARFDPAFDEQKEERETASAVLVEEISIALDAVESLDHDRIIRGFLHLILATDRTNAFQSGANGQAKTYLSFKFDPKRIPGMPQPMPAHEIFVYSRQTEGVHLRGGKVARGGLRWSERHEDYRTEVLGLMKAQMVKNAVIVPVGAKGGFVAKQTNKRMSRDDIQKEVVACYRVFIQALLDVTDNRVAGEIVQPPDLVCYDGYDPYLVVAADKGTATFSDIANDISEERGFWLGDAFASGGSAGYDHKAMGITAKGAWESVKRHFFEMGRDPARDLLTIVGIGDMSGDVFGNGMICSDKIQLLAAFDHRDIFIDPSPDPASSFAERMRLFEIGRGSWKDYDRSLMSKGSAIISRQAKSVELSPEALRALGIPAHQSRMTPMELIRAIVRAPVDLFWNGGIGTYIKSRHESHADVRDKGNDFVRADGQDLRFKIIGEGGNLGVTQLGRLEFAENGGAINTDAIDNAAGVNCSDHEVNIKILLNQLVTDDDLTRKQRDSLLVEMTDAVSEHVLSSNRDQARAISLRVATGAQNLSLERSLVLDLESRGLLNRALEFLPTDAEFEDMSGEGRGLNRPQVSVLIAYTKSWLKEAILPTDLSADDDLLDLIFEYFPEPIRERFPDAIRSHQLRREIISNIVANRIVDLGGGLIIHQLIRDGGISVEHAVRSMLVTHRLFEIYPMWQDMIALESTGIEASIQTDLLRRIREFTESMTAYYSDLLPRPVAINAVVAQQQACRALICQSRDALLTEELTHAIGARVHEDVQAGLPLEVAEKINELDLLTLVHPIMQISETTSRALEPAARMFFVMLDALEMMPFLRRLDRLDTDSVWDRQAARALRHDVFNQLVRLTSLAIQAGNENPEDVKGWIGKDDASLQRCREMINRAAHWSGTDVPVSLMMVAAHSLSALGRVRTEA